MSDESFENALKEIRAHQDARRSHEMRDLDISITACHIQESVSEDQFKAWKLIESLVTLSADTTKKKELCIDADDLRKKLKELN